VGSEANTPKVVELFSIGTELVIGRIRDTNSFWLGEQLARMGAMPRRITVLPDDPDEIAGALADSIRRGTDVILITGGLGPTPDDLTVECVARLLGVPVVVHSPTLARFKQRRNITSDDQVTPGMRKMASVPQGSRVWENPAGWAPLISVQLEQTTIYMMPGPPLEMEAIFEAHLRSLLSETFQTTSAARRVLVEMFESEVSPLLQEVMKRLPRTYLKAYVAMRTETGLPVDIVAYGQDEGAAVALLDEATEILRTLVAERNRGMYLLEEASTGHVSS
jgi:nicotinamide-nucleotide amidase